jgi:hypothetical protein
MLVFKQLFTFLKRAVPLHGISWSVTHTPYRTNIPIGVGVGVFAVIFVVILEQFSICFRGIFAGIFFIILEAFCGHFSNNIMSVFSIIFAEADLRFMAARRSCKCRLKGERAQGHRSSFHLPCPCGFHFAGLLRRHVRIRAH